MALIYNTGKKLLADGTLGPAGWIDGTANIGVALVTSSYGYDPNHVYLSDITGELTGAGGYARETGLTGRAITVNTTTNRSQHLGDDVVYPSIDIPSGQPHGVVVYNAAPATDAERHLICYGALITPKVPNSSEYRIAWDASGVFYFGD